jgi:hypothetical protein
MSDDNKICYPNPLNRIDWQRSNAEDLKAWFSKIAEWYQVNHCDFWDNYLKDIFDLRTCNDFGLSVWAIILDEPTFGVTKPSDKVAWGFGIKKANFNNGNFGVNSDAGYNFTTEEARILLLIKAFILHMSGSVHGDDVIGINESLERIFGQGAIVCIDNRDMSFTYIVNSNEVKSLVVELYSRDLLPSPTGIEIKLVLDGQAKQWGFGSKRANFNNGSFYAGKLIG